MKMKWGSAITRYVSIMRELMGKNPAITKREARKEFLRTCERVSAPIFNKVWVDRNRFMKKPHLSQKRTRARIKEPELRKKIYFRLKKEINNEDRHLFMRKLQEAGATNVTHSDLVDPIADVTDEILVRFQGHEWVLEWFEVRPINEIRY